MLCLTRPLFLLCVLKCHAQLVYFVLRVADLCCKQVPAYQRVYRENEQVRRLFQRIRESPAKAWIDGVVGTLQHILPADEVSLSLFFFP